MNNKSTRSINYFVLVSRMGGAGVKFIFIKLIISVCWINGNIGKRKSFLPSKKKQTWLMWTHLNFLYFVLAARGLPTSQTQWKQRWNTLDQIVSASASSFDKASRAHRLGAMALVPKKSQRRSMSSFRACPAQTLSASQSWWVYFLLSLDLARNFPLFLFYFQHTEKEIQFKSFITSLRHTDFYA